MRRLRYIVLALSILSIWGVWVFPGPQPETALASEAIRWVNGKLQPLPDGFPDRAINLVAAFPPGHPADVYLRVMSKAAKEYSPVPLGNDARSMGPRAWWALSKWFETQPGGTEGYYVGEAAFGSVPTRSFTQKIGNQTYRDVNPVITTEIASSSVSVRADSPWQTLDQLIEWAKKHPGKLKAASSATGSGVHLVIAALANQEGFTFTYIPHRGTAKAILTVLGGGADLVVASAVTVKQHVQEKKLRLLLIVGPSRVDWAPNAPTAKERGYSIPMPSSRGIYTHPNVPKERVKWLFELFKKAAGNKIYQDRLNSMAMSPVIWDREETLKDMDATARVVKPLLLELGLHK